MDTLEVVGLVWPDQSQITVVSYKLNSGRYGSRVPVPLYTDEFGMSHHMSIGKNSAFTNVETGSMAAGLGPVGPRLPEIRLLGKDPDLKYRPPPLLEVFHF